MTCPHCQSTAVRRRKQRYIEHLNDHPDLRRALGARGGLRARDHRRHHPRGRPAPVVGLDERDQPAEPTEPADAPAPSFAGHDER